jgi:hypothetical protein
MNVTLYPKFSIQGMSRRENEVESAFVFCGSKRAQFSSPLKFLLRPPSKVGLTLNLGDPWTKILTANQFLVFKIIFKNLLKNSLLHFVAPFHFTLHPKAIKLKGGLLKEEPWPLRGFLHGFSFQV